MPKQHVAFSDAIMQWWKAVNHNMTYKLLHMAQHGNETERLRALYTLNSSKHLKGISVVIV